MKKALLMLMLASNLAWAGEQDSFDLSFSSCTDRAFDPPLQMVVQDNVADVRSQPEEHTGGYVYDPLQETQVIKDEPVLVYEIKGKWARIEAPLQMEYTHNDRWQGYPGWVQVCSLKKPTFVLVRPRVETHFTDDLRRTIIEQAERHIGSSYLWGGRSLYDSLTPNPLTGVDCSGLINYSYWQVKIPIPRDAHEQYMRSRLIEPEKLKMGDLVFIAKAEKPDRIVHELMYIDGEVLIEAPQSGEKVHKTTFFEKFGRSKFQLKNAQIVGDRVVFFGTILGKGSTENMSWDLIESARTSSKKGNHP